MNKQLVSFGELPFHCEFSYIGYKCKKISAGVAEFYHFNHKGERLTRADHFDCHNLVSVDRHSRLGLNYFL